MNGKWKTLLLVLLAFSFVSLYTSYLRLKVGRLYPVDNSQDDTHALKERRLPDIHISDNTRPGNPDNHVIASHISDNTTISNHTATSKRVIITQPNTKTALLPVDQASGPSQPTMVLMLTYNRCGSTFMGNIFNSNPDAFYSYEPLDATYVHLYGTKLGWNVHTDITHFPNMTRRKIPDEEIQSMARTIQELLTCDVKNMWPEVAFNDFWNQFAGTQDLVNFQKCLKKKRISPRNCHAQTRKVCGVTFDPIKTPGKCHDMLMGKTKTVKREVSRYQKCLKGIQDKGAECLIHLQKKCDTSTLRSVKTVRAPMEVAEVLLEKMPNLKVLHLVRDPRPVALSRRGHSSFRSQYSEFKKDGKNIYDLVREAALYCDSVQEDVHKRNLLTDRYPDRVQEVIFEDFVQTPIEATEDIYNFMGATIHTEVTDWLKNHTNKSQNIATKWQDSLSWEVWDKVYSHPLCKQLYHEFKEVWPAKKSS